MAETIDRTCKVYGLASTRGGGIRYVGQTFDKIERRLTGHLWSARNHHQRRVCRWIKRELVAGYKITASLIESGAVHNEAEIRWIATLKESGARLLNATLGGKGILGHEQSASHRAKIGASLRGKPKTIEHVAAVAAALSGRKPSTQTVAAVRIARAGKPWPDKMRAVYNATPAEVLSARAALGRSRLLASERPEISKKAAMALWAQRRIAGTDRGVHVNSAKLSDAAVRQIRSLLASGLTIAGVARQFDVWPISIRNIRDRKTWAHVP